MALNCERDSTQRAHHNTAKAGNRIRRRIWDRSAHGLLERGPEFLVDGIRLVDGINGIEIGQQLREPSPRSWPRLKALSHLCPILIEMVFVAKNSDKQGHSRRKPVESSDIVVKNRCHASQRLAKRRSRLILPLAASSTRAVKLLGTITSGSLASNGQPPRTQRVPPCFGPRNRRSGQLLSRQFPTLAARISWLYCWSICSLFSG